MDQTIHFVLLAIGMVFLLRMLGTVRRYYNRLHALNRMEKAGWRRLLDRLRSPSESPHYSLWRRP